MGAIGDEMALQDQEKLDQQQAAQNAREYNADGSAKANDFRPPKLPESTFPKGLDSGKELTVDRGQLNVVRGQMAADLARLQGTLSQLQGEGAMGGAIGGWTTADGFGSNATNAYEGISQFIQALNSAYDLVIGNLSKTVTNYADAEATTASAASRIGADSAPGGA
ncbi:MAG TPA: hypothetical protein VMF87_08960 [Streptosporangiaceae bacterium]|jgi:hypothetical protein|nr:hypothetical protein [Streptosporangiaceae bacterium]